MLNKLKNKFMAWLLKDLYALQATQLGYLIGNSQKLSNVQVSLNRFVKMHTPEKIDEGKLEEYYFKNLLTPEDETKWM